MHIGVGFEPNVMHFYHFVLFLVHIGMYQYVLGLFECILVYTCINMDCINMSLYILVWTMFVSV